MFEKHGGIKIICICVDTTHSSLASAGSLSLMKRSSMGVWEWGVGGGFVEDPLHLGSVHKGM